MDDREAEVKGLLPLVVSYIRNGTGTYGSAAYHGHSIYELVGNILIAIPPGCDDRSWRSWRAYDATDCRLLYSPELANDDLAAHTVRAMVFRYLERRSLQGMVETPLGRFYCTDGMLILESSIGMTAWNTMELNLHDALSISDVEAMRKYFREMEAEYDADLMQWADNENERRIDEYFSRPR